MFTYLGPPTSTYLHQHIYLPISNILTYLWQPTNLCQPTYHYQPTSTYLPTYVFLPTHVNLPSSTYLPVPIPKYQFIIAADPGAGIGLVLIWTTLLYLQMELWTGCTWNIMWYFIHSPYAFWESFLSTALLGWSAWPHCDHQRRAEHLQCLLQVQLQL